MSSRGLEHNLKSLQGSSKAFVLALDSASELVKAFYPPSSAISSQAPVSSLMQNDLFLGCHDLHLHQGRNE